MLEYVIFIGGGVLIFIFALVYYIHGRDAKPPTDPKEGPRRDA